MKLACSSLAQPSGDRRNIAQSLNAGTPDGPWITPKLDADRDARQGHRRYRDDRLPQPRPFHGGGCSDAPGVSSLLPPDSFYKRPLRIAGTKSAMRGFIPARIRRCPSALRAVESAQRLRPEDASVKSLGVLAVHLVRLTAGVWSIRRTHHSGNTWACRSQARRVAALLLHFDPAVWFGPRR